MQLRTVTSCSWSVAERDHATLYEQPQFHFIRDIAPIAGLIRGGPCHGGTSLGSAKTLSRVHRLCQANPGKLSYGSGGVGGITHITAELFKQEAGGLDMCTCPIAAWRLRSPICSATGPDPLLLTLPINWYIGTGKLRAPRN